VVKRLPIMTQRACKLLSTRVLEPHVARFGEEHSAFKYEGRTHRRKGGDWAKGQRTVGKLCTPVGRAHLAIQSNLN
jgi:hypothetical protein